MSKWVRDGNKITQIDDGTAMIYHNNNGSYSIVLKGIKEGWERDPYPIERESLPKELLERFPDF
ncbi:MAG: hypothetical protein ACE5J3_10350 [Methanosarcinales archaeon]